MTDDSGITKPARQGEPWTGEAEARLAELLSGPDGLDVVAQRLGRSVTAVRGRARQMLPDSPEVPAGPAAVDWLRAQLRLGFDWQAVLEARRRPAQAYQPWTEGEVELLIGAVRSGLPWPDVARSHGRTESAVLRRLSDLLPSDIGGRRSDRARADSLRALLSAHPSVPWRELLVPRVHVLVGWDGGTVAHVSVHPDEPAALSTRSSADPSLTWSLTTHPLHQPT